MSTQGLVDAYERGDSRMVAHLVREELSHGTSVVSSDVVRRTKRERDEGKAAHPYRDHATGLASALDKVLSGEKRNSSAFFDRDDLCACAAKVMSDNAVSLARSAVRLRQRQLDGFASSRNEWTCAVDGPVDEDHVGFSVDDDTGRIDTFVTDGVKAVVVLNPAMTGEALPMGFRLKTAYPSYEARDADCMWHRGASPTLVRQSRTYLGADAIGRAWMLERCRPDHMCPMDYSYESGLSIYGQSSVVSVARDGSVSVDGMPCDDDVMDELDRVEPKLAREASRVMSDAEDLMPRRSRARSYADMPDDLFPEDDDGLSYD